MHSELHAGRTTNFRRTIGTLELLVAGLLQKAEESVEITTATELDEILFCNVKRCAQLGSLMSSQRSSIACALHPCNALSPHFISLCLADGVRYSLRGCHPDVHSLMQVPVSPLLLLMFSLAADEILINSTTLLHARQRQSWNSFVAPYILPCAKMS